MPKFRKRPVLTEAMQYTGDNRIEITEWVHRGLPDIANAIVRLGYGDSLILRHKEGDLTVRVGDWIIRGNCNGEFYPQKHDEFVAEYDEAV